jgi:hypothetical protein
MPGRFCNTEYRFFRPNGKPVFVPSEINRQIAKQLLKKLRSYPAAAHAVVGFEALPAFTSLDIDLGRASSAPSRMSALGQLLHSRPTTPYVF